MKKTGRVRNRGSVVKTKTGLRSVPFVLVPAAKPKPSFSAESPHPQNTCHRTIHFGQTPAPRQPLIACRRRFPVHLRRPQICLIHTRYVVVECRIIPIYSASSVVSLRREDTVLLRRKKRGRVRHVQSHGIATTNPARTSEG
jgi:hypothetical protein